MRKLILIMLLVFVYSLSAFATETESSGNDAVQLEQEQTTENIAISDYVTDTKEYGSFKITCYVLAEDKELLPMVAKDAGEAYQLGEKLLGSNPIKIITIREVRNMSDEGVNSGNGVIEISNAMFGNKKELRRVLEHEIVHCWHADLCDFWLSEGMGTLFPHYMEARRNALFGADNYFAYLNKIYANPYNSKMSKDIPLSYFSESKNLDYDKFGQDGKTLVYDKGGYVLEMLRQTIGDDMFFKATRKFYANFKTITTKGFEKAVNEVTGKNYHWFFEQWVYKSGYPYLTFNYEVKGNILKVKIAQKKGLFRLPLPLVVKTAKGKKTFTLDLRKKEQTWNLKVVGKVQSVSLDPYHHFLKFVEGSGDDFAAQGEEALNAEDYAKAQVLFSKALMVEPEHLDSLFGMTKVYIKLGNIGDAEKNFEKILNLESENITALAGLAEVYQSSGKSDEAGQIYEKLLTIINNQKNMAPSYETELMLDVIPGKIALLKGRNEEAISLFSKAIMARGESSDIRLLRAQANLNLRKIDEVMDDCNYLDGIQARLSDNQLAKLDLLYARVFDLLGKREDAVAKYKEVFDLNADGAEIAEAKKGIAEAFK